MSRFVAFVFFCSRLVCTGQDKPRNSVNERDLSARLILEQKQTKETTKNQFPFLLRQVDSSPRHDRSSTAGSLRSTRKLSCDRVLAAFPSEPPQEAGVDYVVAHLGGGHVVIVASCCLQVGSRRAGEASCAAPGCGLSAGERNEEGIGE